MRDALKDAIGNLKQAPDIEEPNARETREGIHLDHDVKDVPGSPDLARTILVKIDAARVVVADVTIVGKTEGQGVAAGKKLINSNVAIELGYAYRSRGDENVLLVLNAHYGAHEDLPFDLRHKGGAVVFNLPPDADKARIEAERKKLAAQFVSKLSSYTQTLPSALAVAIQETPSTYLRATYFSRGEILAQIGEPEDLLEYSYETDQLAYIRLVPTSARTRPILLSDLRFAAAHMPMMRLGGSALVATNQYGAIGYEPDAHPPKGRAPIRLSTQLFPNGELWSIATRIIVTTRGDRPTWIKVPFIHALTFEQRFYDALHGLLDKAASRLSLSTPWQIELGLVGTKGAHIAGMPENEQWGPIQKPEITQRTILNDHTPNAVNSILLSFFTQVYDATGYSRPVELHGFPTSRPSNENRN